MTSEMGLWPWWAVFRALDGLGHGLPSSFWVIAIGEKPNPAQNCSKVLQEMGNSLTIGNLVEH